MAQLENASDGGHPTEVLKLRNIGSWGGVPVIADDADPTYNNPEIFFYRARRHRFAITG